MRSNLIRHNVQNSNIWRAIFHWLHVPATAKCQMPQHTNIKYYTHVHRSRLLNAHFPHRENERKQKKNNIFNFIHSFQSIQPHSPMAIVFLFFFSFFSCTWENVVARKKCFPYGRAYRPHVAWPRFTYFICLYRIRFVSTYRHTRKRSKIFNFFFCCKMCLERNF